MKRPTDTEIRKVVKWLEEELGLSIYGPCIDLKNFVEHPAHMDYTVKDILRYDKLWQKYPEGPTRYEA